MEVANLSVAIAVLVCTVVLIGLSVPLVLRKSPSFRLDQLRVAPYRIDGTFAIPGENTQLTLVFVNDGPGIAPALNSCVSGGIVENNDEFQFPVDGSPTVTVGGLFSIPEDVKMLEGSGEFEQRRYTHGDDYFFDLSGVRIRFERGLRGKCQIANLQNLHPDQQNASPQVEPPPAGWVAAGPRIVLPPLLAN